MATLTQTKIVTPGAWGDWRSWVNGWTLSTLAIALIAMAVVTTYDLVVFKMVEPESTAYQLMAPLSWIVFGGIMAVCLILLTLNLIARTMHWFQAQRMQRELGLIVIVPIFFLMSVETADNAPLWHMAIPVGAYLALATLGWLICYYPFVGRRV